MKIAVLDDYQGVARDLADWRSLGAEISFFRDTIGGPALVERLKPFDIVCLMRERTLFGADVIDALPALKLIVTSGVRNAAIDLAAAAARGIPVCGTETRGPSTSQFTMGLILAASRGIAMESASMRDGGWQAGLGRDLHGLTMGVIGLGKLGAQVVALARPFGVEFVAWSENLTDARCAEVGVRRAASLGDLLAEADIATVHQLLSPRSRGLIGAAEIARMKPDALLVNTSRGPIVEWRAVLEALKAGRLGQAAIDVYDEEPLAPDHPLRDRDLIDSGRLLLTPHVAYVTRQTYELFYSQTVEAVAAWKAGAPVRVIA